MTRECERRSERQRGGFSIGISPRSSISRGLTAKSVEPALLSSPYSTYHLESMRVLNQRGERIRMQKSIMLVDRGRGLQLSTSRITVHDLVPYFQDGCSHDEIIHWIPSLTHDEIAIVESYYLQHKGVLDEYESRIQAYRAEQIRLQRLRFPERKGNRHERLSELRQLLRLRRGETSDEGARR
jgi:uncharacterized protein (DUF433 family)